MKWRILAAFLFAWLVFSGMQSLSVTEPPAIPPQLAAQPASECALPPAPAQTAAVQLFSSTHITPVQDADAPRPLLCSHNGTPLLSVSYYRAAYQAFHFSDSAG